MITEEQMQNLQDKQNCRFIHPHICGGNCNIKDNRLIPKEDKWYCPCGNYTQEYRGEQNDTKWKLIENAYKDHPLLGKQNKVENN